MPLTLKNIVRYNLNYLVQRTLNYLLPRTLNHIVSRTLNYLESRILYHLVPRTLNYLVHCTLNYLVLRILNYIVPHTLDHIVLRTLNHLVPFTLSHMVPMLIDDEAPELRIACDEIFGGRSSTKAAKNGKACGSSTHRLGRSWRTGECYLLSQVIHCRCQISLDFAIVWARLSTAASRSWLDFHLSYKILWRG